jgi:hypothetical protein
MKLYPIEAGNFKLDGGAMFGVVPKTIWNKTNPADENNLIDIAARCLLIEDGNRLILIDTGMGNKQSEKFFGYYSLWGSHSLDKSLAKYGMNLRGGESAASQACQRGGRHRRPRRRPCSRPPATAPTHGRRSMRVPATQLCAPAPTATPGPSTALLPATSDWSGPRCDEAPSPVGACIL